MSDTEYHDCTDCLSGELRMSQEPCKACLDDDVLWAKWESNVPHDAVSAADAVMQAFHELRACDCVGDCMAREVGSCHYGKVCDAAETYRRLRLNANDRRFAPSTS